MKHAFFVLLSILLVPSFVLGQAQNPPAEEGQVWGDYTVHSSVEFGGHIADTAGSESMYSTLVDINSGPRLLEQELTMQSRTRIGGFFDDLYMSSFGYGGDPEAMTRFRLEKDHWYNFVALYRRDKNIFDYNLFGNPLNLNQGITTCGVGCTNAFTPTALPWYDNSTRLMAETRNMGDFSLTLMPQSKASLRLGYARNATYGLMYSDFRTPLVGLLSQDSQWRSDRYQIGLDLKQLPRTTLSFDVFYEFDKNDIGFTDAPNQLYTLGNAAGQQITFNGQPIAVDTGMLLPPLAGGTSCAGAGNPSVFTGGLFLLSSGCSAVTINSGPGGGYFRRGNVRTSIPTGQFSFQSSYFRNLDLTGNVTYSSSSSNFYNFGEFAHFVTAQPAAPAPGTVSTTNSNLFLINGDPSADRSSANADLGATYHITRTIAASDTFRWLNWRQHGLDAETRYGCFLTNTTYATAAGTVGTFASLLNPCFKGILNLINPVGGPALIGTAGNVGAGRGNYAQDFSNGTLVGERSYFNTFKVSWQPSRHFSGYVGYRFARRDFQDGNLDITGLLWEITSNFVNVGGGTVPTVPACNTATPDPGCDLATGIITNAGGADSAQLNQHTALVGVAVHPVDNWLINADLEWLYSDNYFTNIYPRHQQRLRLFSRYKPLRWLSFNGGVHLVESRNDYAASTVQDENGATPGDPLFPASFISTAYGNKNHWRYYTLGSTVTRKSITLDLGWTLQDQLIDSATCMPLAANAFAGTVTAPPACNNGLTARALLLNYREKTHSGYINLSYQPVRRATLTLGYDITADNGRTDWLRSDTLTPLQVVGDIYGNSPPLAGNPITPCPTGDSGAGCIFLGPFPDQPLGPQATNWHKAHAGIAVEVVKGIQFKGLWEYYDYNGKDEVPALSLLRVTAPRDFHANVGTLSLRYSF